MIETDLPPLIIAKDTEREMILQKPLIGGGMSIGLAGADYAATFANLGLAGTLGGVGRVFIDNNRKLARTLWKADCLALQQEINHTRDMSPDGFIGVNILMAGRWHKQLIQEAIGPKGQKSKINYLVLGAGFNKDVPLWTKDHPEVALFLMASSGLGAIMMAKEWEENGHLPDGIIMEEPKTAGGHLGAKLKSVDKDMLKLEHTIPDLLKRFKEQDYSWNIPIIAAGGIWNKNDIRRMLKLGASGVQMATKFVCTPECAAPEVFKQKYIDSKEEDIALIDSPAGYPGRVIRNNFVKQLEEGKIHDKCLGNCLIECACRKFKTHFCLIDRLVKAYEGDVENGLVFCGSNAWRAEKIEPLQQIIEELVYNPINARVLS